MKKLHIRFALQWTAIIIGLVVALAAPFHAFGDSGFYTQSAHGKQTTGVSRDSTLPTGSCAQCHNGHGGSFQDFGLWVSNDNNLCFTCHGNAQHSYFGQTTYATSGHASSTSSWNGRAVGYCVQCHNVHGAGDSGNMYAHLTSAAGEQVCFTCHGTSIRPINAEDMQTQVNKQYAHQTANGQGLHDDYAESTSLAVKPNPLLSGSKRHVECADCHNSHYGRKTLHTAQSSNIGEILLGSWGVRPTFPGSPSIPPTSYSVQRFLDTSTSYEYYLCLKCHSDWAWGTAPPNTRDGIVETNTAIEINPANASYHNVTGQLPAQVPASNGGAYIAPWTFNSAMVCTDCHGSDPSSSTQGAHGSTYAFMLKQPFQANLSAAGNTGTAGTSSHLCFTCHDWNTYGPGGAGSTTNFSSAGMVNLHTNSNHITNNGCFLCHTVVPHGFDRKHMIVYATDPAPYFIGGTKGIQSYTPTSAGLYSKTNCSTTATGCH